MLTFNFTNEYFALNRETPLTELPSFKSMIKRTGVAASYPEDYATYLRWSGFLERQFHRIGATSLPYAFFPLSYVELSNAEHAKVPLRLFVILGVTACGVILIGLLFVRRHKILLATLALSGFCWALPMRHNVAFPWHDFEAVFYIGVALTLFSLILLYFRKVTSERLIIALSVAALLIFVASALRMAQLNYPNQTAELHQVTMSDFEAIRNVADEKVTQIGVMPTFHKGITMLVHYYLSGRTMTSYKYIDLPSEIAPDFVATAVRIDGLASLTPQNRMAFLYDWNEYRGHIAKFIEQADNLIISSNFDVHLSGSALLYVKDACSANDTDAPFFLAIYPIDENDLPVGSRQHGFHNLDFRFSNQDIQRHGRCIAVMPLPEYDIARIYTGQYIPQADGSISHIWEDEIHLTEATR